ncbi:MAG: DNA double-strand break repair nuclease NurA [Actinobacteria bacterium]|nr:DNA double-strand break repair nuclease NurA [Actinomycetota bacterium]
MTQQEGYARLPEDLLRDLLAGADAVVQEVEALLAPALDGRDRLREALGNLGLIRSLVTQAPQSICGVDGGFAVERTAAADLQLSVAVGVEGLAEGSTRWDGTQYQWWARVAKHDLESERLARGVMVSQELSILAQAPHEVRILDGSHLTLVIQLNSALTAFSDEIRQEVRAVWERLGTVDGLRDAARDHAVIAMPKYDSSRTITNRLEQEVHQEIPGDDKYLLGLILREGELVIPQPVPEHPWSTLHFTARPGDEQIAKALEAAIEPLRKREINFTYFKPSQFSPAFRLETKSTLDDDAIDAICSTLASQITI